MYWHTQVCGEVAKQFDVEIEKGLPSVKVTQRLEKYGPNKLAEKKGISLLGRFLRQFKDFMVIILLIAAVVSLLLGEAVDSAVIFFVVILNAVLGLVQENRAEKALDALKKLSVPQAKVLRDGQRMLINSEELVPGDIIFLEAGDIVPADARLVEAASLKVEESSLTGESVPVEKETGVIEKQDTQLGDRKNMVFSSCTVTYGRGTAIVTETGMDTQVGHIANLLLEENEQQTPLQIRLAQIGRFLGITALVICVVIFLLGIIEGKGLFDMFMTAVALAVAAIPEGMPAIVTIVLAIGVQRMVKHNAIIRRLQAVETLGSASVICSDKTGTLTQNRMTVMECYTDGQHIKPDPAHKDTVMNLLVFASMCNDARAEEGEGGVKFLGDPTETALISAAYGLGIKKGQMDAAYPRVGEVPFDSARKLMSTIHSKDSQYYVVTKGAPDVLLSRCEAIAAPDGFVPLTAEARKQIEQANTNMASRALRVLAVAVRGLAELPEQQTSETVETGLVFVGLIGMIDPPREEVKEAVRLCRQAGIKPVMITGDHVDTACAIAKQLGILKNINEAITGSILDEMSDLELGRRIRDFSVFARVSPEHKVRIVKAWQDAGEIVAMTGDGVNDAPALNAADIGCAMGITGTDVAKGAAHMVLADDNFATIVSAVREGRGIYSNIRKSIQFLLSSNFGEILTILFAMIFRWDVPLLPIHLLWVNLITDSLPALSLGVDTVDESVMKEKPRPKNEGVFAGGLGIVIVLQGLLIGVLTLIAFWMGRYVIDGHSLELGQTMAFAVLSISQLFHAYNVRSKRPLIKLGPFTNRFLNWSFLISFSLQLLLISVPFLAVLFSLVPLGVTQWLWVLLLAVMPVVVVEPVKLLLGALRKR